MSANAATTKRSFVRGSSPQASAASTPVTSGSVSSTVIEAAAMQAALQPWVDMECYQLGPGKQLAQMDYRDLGRQQVVREHQQVAVQKLGITPPDLCTVSCCTPDPRFRFSELQESDADSLFFMPGNTEFDIYVPAGVKTSYVSFSHDEFIRSAQVLDPSYWEQAPAQVQSISTPQQATFRYLVNEFLQPVETSTAWRNAMDDSALQAVLLQSILLMAVATEVNASAVPAVDRAHAFETCKAARTFVDERLAADRVPSIVDICAQVGVSERTLQYAFRAYVHMSPLAYLRMCRLNRARQTLLASDPQSTTVTAVAMRYGFLHLGRFSVDYKRAFDEAPSATLGL